MPCRQKKPRFGCEGDGSRGLLSGVREPELPGTADPCGRTDTDRRTAETPLLPAPAPLPCCGTEKARSQPCGVRERSQGRLGHSSFEEAAPVP